MSLFIDQEWPSPLFDICAAGPTICLLSCFCPCIQYGYNVHNFTYKLQTKPHEDITLPETSCFKATIACACYSLCGCK